jgi:hydrogenase maturation factor
MGKLSKDDLTKLLKCIDSDERVIIPPMAGFDSGVHLIEDKYLVISTDPCIGVPKEWFGWLLVNYAASDVALFGARPEFCTINLLGSPKTSPQEFMSVMKQCCSATKELNMSIVTGHTGTYDNISTMIGVTTAYGIIEKDRLLTPGSAKAGDYIYCIKPVGLEPAVNFALTRKNEAQIIFGNRRSSLLRDMMPSQSCVREALFLAEAGYVHAMHDTTEGGLTMALNEMAEASKLGFIVNYEAIPVCEEARTLFTTFHLSEKHLLSVSSTGTIIASVIPEAREKVDAFLRREKIQGGAIGTFSQEKKRILRRKGKETAFPMEAADPYTRILSGKV